MTAKLQKRNIIGKHYFHVLLQNDSEIAIECSSDDYVTLAKKDGRPNLSYEHRIINKHEFLIDGIWCPWVYSFENYKFDTSDGWLHDGDYFDNGSTYRVQLNGKEGNLEKTEISNDVLSDDGLNVLSKKSIAKNYLLK